VTEVDAEGRESALLRWRRRALSLGILFLGAALVWIGLPVLLGLAALRDLARDRRFPTLRLAAFAALYLACEVAGVLASLALWLRYRGASLDPRGAHAAACYALQAQWLAALFGGLRWIFGLRLEVEGAECLRETPLLIFMRHTSLADTLLPASALAGRSRLRLRYVLKRELLWDPCLDIVGQRLPNVFVRRGTRDPAREAAAIRALVRDLGDREALLIYPEGTRFTREKLAARLREIEGRGDAERLAVTRSLRHVLPPRTAGPLAAIDERAELDVVFLAHTGLEGVASARDALAGALIGRRIRVDFRRVAAAAIPRERAARVAWLDREWAELDARIAAQLD
jgi:1-acyl-sn-glycerol-3-phosphate acyltransferase